MTPNDPNHPTSTPPSQPGSALAPKPAKPRRKATPAQVAAAQKNSKRSTGPHDTTQTRYNGTKHEMCTSNHMVLPGESLDEVDRKTATYINELGAETQAECDVLRKGVEALFRADRCLEADKAATERDVAAAGNAADLKEQKDLDILIEDLRTHPRTAVFGLRQFSSGLLYLLEQVEAIEGGIHGETGHTSVWPTQRVMLIYLLGRRPCDLFVDKVVMDWNLHYLAGLFGGAVTVEQAVELLADDKPADMSQGEFRMRLETAIANLPDRLTGRDLLREMLARAREELTERLALTEAREQRDILLAEKAADVSVNRDCMLRQRYFRENTNSFLGALRQFRLLVEQRRKAEGGPSGGSKEATDGGRKEGKRSEAGAAQGEGGQGSGAGSAASRPGGAGGAEVRVSSDRKAGPGRGCFVVRKGGPSAPIS